MPVFSPCLAVRLQPHTVYKVTYIGLGFRVRYVGSGLRLARGPQVVGPSGPTRSGLRLLVNMARAVIHVEIGCSSSEEQIILHSHVRSIIRVLLYNADYCIYYLLKRHATAVHLYGTLHLRVVGGSRDAA